MPMQAVHSVTGIKYTNGDGYYFRLSQRLNGKLYLNCQVKSCQVRGNLPLDYYENDEINVRGEHNHPPDLFELEFCDAERRILDRATREPTSLRQIFDEETSHLSPKTINRLNYPSFLRRMQRRRHHNIRQLPNTLHVFSQRMGTAEYQEFATIGDEKFFISTINDHSILFMSPTMRELFKQDDQTFIIYETKKLISRNLKNALIIVQIQLNVAFPLAYVAMQKPTSEAYVDIFRAIMKEEPLWNPSALFMSREESLVSAVQKVFPECEVIPSWFHLAQELRKEIKSLNLVDLLHSDPDFFNCVELLQGLPMLPSEFMSTGAELVKNSTGSFMTQPGVTQLFNFLSENWLPESVSSCISVFQKVERLKTELKLMHRQFMSSFRASARKDLIWSFTKGLTTFEKKYADAYRELLATNSPPKWTANCLCKSQEKKVNALMGMFAEDKLTIESFLEQTVKTGVNVMDLSGDDIPEVSNEDDTEDGEETHGEGNNITGDDESNDFEEYIVEEVEEYVESEGNPVNGIIEKDAPSKPCPDDEETDNSHRKRHQSFKKQSPKKIKMEDNKIESTLIFASTPVKKTSMIDDCTPHACVKCQTSLYAFACQPCGHLCLCRDCCKDMTQKNCPMCSKVVLWVQEIIPATPFDHPFKFEIMSMPG